MEARLINLKQTFLGLQKTGIPLIQFDGTNLLPSFTADDIGIYVLIPKLASLLNIPIESAINLFFYSLIIIPGLIGIIGFFYYYSSALQRIIACIAILFLMRQAYFIGDVYLAYFTSIIAFVPWSLYFAKRASYDWSLIFFSFIMGLMLTSLGYIRSYAGFGVLLFTCILFFMKRKFSKRELAKLLIIFLLGSAIPSFYFNHQYNKAIIYTKKNLDDNLIGQKAHVFWHPLYLGFGLLKLNAPDDIIYNDNFGLKKARKIEPNVIMYSANYENILKNEIINIIKNHWQFFIFTIFAKIGILLFYLLKYANIGLLAALIYRKPWYLEISFWVGISFYALFPILTMPTFIEYVLGFITFVTLYSIVSINYAINQGMVKSMVNMKTKYL